MFAWPLPLRAAESWPARPIRMLVAFPPGGGADVSARIVMQRLSETLGQPVVIENRVGANGGIGAESVVHAQADGYTLLFGSSANITINPHLMHLAYDPMKDLVPVSMVAFSPLLVFVNPGVVPVNTIHELVQYVQARPGTVNFASAGNGSQGHLAAELLNLMAGIHMVHIPYKGGPPAVNGTLAGEVGVSFASAPSVLSYTHSGRLRGLATTGQHRSAFAPDLPTVAESGYPDYDVVIWSGVFAPFGTAAEIITRLHGEITRAVQQPDIRAALIKSGAEPMVLSAAELDGYLRTDFARWRKVVQAAKIVMP